MTMMEFACFCGGLALGLSVSVLVIVIWAVIEMVTKDK